MKNKLTMLNNKKQINYFLKMKYDFENKLKKNKMIN